jgi:C4-type Zn-finger protein
VRDQPVLPRVQGTVLRLRVETGRDLARRVLKSDTAAIEVPELDLEVTMVS